MYALPFANKFQPGCGLVLARKRRKELPVEYRRIRYTVRARIEGNRWTVCIHPGGIEGPETVVSGTRERAVLLARSLIDKWYKQAAQSAANSNNPTNVAKLPELPFV
jgi:hypothetical protein